MTADSSDDAGADEPVDQPTATGRPADDGARGADRPLVSGLTTAVGAFVVFGVGLVFTSFFASQFTGGTGAGGGLVTTAGGLGFVVLLSPVLAVLVGLELGRGDASPVDATVASAVGFVAMYLVTVVVASSLYAPDASSLGIGPLAGYVVGVALTGGAAAAIPDRDISAAVGGAAVGRPAVFGAATIVTYAVGFGVSAVLADTLAGPAAGSGSPAFAAPGAEFALVLGTAGVPVTGVLAGYLGTPDDATEQAAVAGGAAAGAIGGAVAVAVFYVAATVVASGGSFPLGQLVGVAVGTALTTAGAAVVATRD
jgi:hypothetical protein